MASSISVSEGAGFLGQQRCGLHDLARLAVAALRHLMIDPGLLNRGHRVRGANAFNRGHIAPDIGQGHLARTHSLAVNVHGARPASGHAAAEFGASQTDLIP